MKNTEKLGKIGHQMCKAEIEAYAQRFKAATAAKGASTKY